MEKYEIWCIEPADIYREETDTEQPRQSSTNVSQEFSLLISFNSRFCYHMFAVYSVVTWLWHFKWPGLNGQGLDIDCCV